MLNGTLETVRIWITGHSRILSWLGGVSFVFFVASLLIIPVLVARMPQDYFVRSKREHYAVGRVFGMPRLLAHVLKNLCGILLILAGIAMLVLPGQGILTILIGLMCLEFPGKRALELRLVRRPRILAAINWIRQRAHRDVLHLPETDEMPSA